MFGGATSSWPVFIGVTVVLFGGAALMMGQALGQTWRPPWQTLFYGALLGLANRFIVFGLFGEPGLSVSGYVIDTAVLIGIAWLAYRVTQAHKMVTQYPWLYERSGLFAWRERTPGH